MFELALETEIPDLPIFSGRPSDILIQLSPPLVDLYRPELGPPEIICQDFLW